MDGTKTEASINRDSFVRKTAVTKKQSKLGEKITSDLPKLPATLFDQSLQTHSRIPLDGIPLWHKGILV